MVTPEQIREKAREMAVEKGLVNLTRAALCEAAGIPDGSFPHVMGCTFTDLVNELQGAGIGTSTSSPITTKRANPQVRKALILDAALTAAKKHGFSKITREQVALEAKVAPSSVSHYFNTMTQLRRAIMRAAIQNQNLPIIAQGLVAGDSNALKAPRELRLKAAASLAEG